MGSRYTELNTFCKVMIGFAYMLLVHTTELD